MSLAVAVSVAVLIQYRCRRIAWIQRFHAFEIMLP
jgi:hypothetical protein